MGHPYARPSITTDAGSDLWALGMFFVKVGAFTFGGGLSMLAFIQEQVVNQFGWLVEPCLPSPAERPPAGSNWLHEIKHDGFRIMARRGGAGVGLFSRNGHDFTSHSLMSTVDTRHRQKTFCTERP
jgi:chromate transporter